MQNIVNIVNSFNEGATSYPFLTLTVLTLVDLVLGNARAIVQKKVNSSIGKNGIIKNAVMVFVPMLIYPFADVLGYSSLADTFIAFLALSQAYSVVENWVGLGLPLDKRLQAFFDDKKIEQKQRVGSIHTDEIVPDETDKKL